MEKIPTAKKVYHTVTGCVLESHHNPDIEKAMIEFAKLHVEAALKEASKKSKVRKDTYVNGGGKTEVEQMFNYSNGTSHYVDQVSILNSYPLEKVK